VHANRCLTVDWDDYELYDGSDYEPGVDYELQIGEFAPQEGLRRW